MRVRCRVRVRVRVRDRYRIRVMVEVRVEVRVRAHHARVQSCSKVGRRSRKTQAGVAHAIRFRTPGTWSPLRLGLGLGLG